MLSSASLITLTQTLTMGLAESNGGYLAMAEWITEGALVIGWLGLAAVGFLISVWLRLQAERRQLKLLEERFAIHVRALGGAALAARLSTMFSHELRQPIAAILLNAQGALRMLQKADIRHDGINESLQDIINDDSRLDGLVQHWRALLMNESSEVESLDVGAELHGIMRLLAGEWLRKGLQPDLQIANDLPALQWNRAGFTQLVVGLLLASVDSMSGKGLSAPTLAVRAERNGADAISISIRDNGQRHAEQVTESFTSLPNAGAADEVRMGLFAVASIIRSRGGDITAATALDGMTVTCTLPILSPSHS